MLRDDHHHKNGVKLCFVHLREGGLPPGRLGGLFYFASLRSLFIPLRFSCGPAKGDLQEIPARRSCRRRKSGFPLEKRCFLNLFWAGVPVDSTRLCFADLMRVFPSGSISAPSPLGCGVCVDVKVPASRFIASPAVAAAAAFLSS
ncbi:hypothetical protein TcCL_ESM10578 [Trypanosoma cruzi]|nr:hypothetical protein TcCL_ESM10578 [Trypanosoma cruzi]